MDDDRECGPFEAMEAILRNLRKFEALRLQAGLAWPAPGAGGRATPSRVEVNTEDAHHHGADAPQAAQAGVSPKPGATKVQLPKEARRALAMKEM